MNYPNLCLSLALALVSFTHAQDYLRFTAPVGTETHYSVHTEMQTKPLDYTWSGLDLTEIETLDTPQSLSAMNITKRVISPQIIETQMSLDIPILDHSCSLTFAMRHRYQEDYLSLDSDSNALLNDVSKQFLGCLEVADISMDVESIKESSGDFIRAFFDEMAKAMNLSNKRTALPHFQVPLIPGRQVTVTETNPGPFGIEQTVTTDVTYLGMSEGLHTFITSTFMPYTKLDLSKLTDLGLNAIEGMTLSGWGGYGPSMSIAEQSYYPDGRLAKETSTSKTLQLQYTYTHFDMVLPESEALELETYDLEFEDRPEHSFIANEQIIYSETLIQDSP